LHGSTSVLAHLTDADGLDDDLAQELLEAKMKK
jgi:hypothetical protein